MERVGAARGLVSPGVIATPPAASTETQREERDRTAIMEASRWETDPYTLWTDGSALPSGVSAAAVVGHISQQSSQEKGRGRQIISGGNHLGSTQRKESGGGRDKRSQTYGEMTRSIRTIDRDGGFRAEAWSLGAQSSSFDAELAALVRAVEICALDAEEGRVFRVFTDSQAATQRLPSDRPGLGQALPRRGIRITKLGIIDRGANIIEHAIPPPLTLSAYCTTLALFPQFFEWSVLVLVEGVHWLYSLMMLCSGWNSTVWPCHNVRKKQGFRYSETTKI